MDNWQSLADIEIETKKEKIASLLSIAKVLSRLQGKVDQYLTEAFHKEQKEEDKHYSHLKNW